MFRIKEEDKTSEKEVDEVEISSLPNKELKVMIKKCSVNSEKEQMNTERIACPAPLCVEFSRQEYWSGLPFPPPRKYKEDPNKVE